MSATRNGNSARMSAALTASPRRRHGRKASSVRDALPGLRTCRAERGRNVQPPRVALVDPSRVDDLVVAVAVEVVEDGRLLVARALRSEERRVGKECRTSGGAV